jgi:hypothetical protein
MKWWILLGIPSYPLEKQSKIILACMALHNFIRDSAMSDKDFDRCDEDETYMPMPMPMPTENSSQLSDGDIHIGNDGDMNAFRDSICNALMPNKE